MGNSRSETSAPESAEGLPLDRLFELLSAERRRRVIACLQESGDPVTLDDLAGRITDEAGAQSSDGAPDHRAAVRRSLYHRHVPKLDDADVVAHDRDRNTVEPAANFQRAAELLNSLPGPVDSGSE